ncbi:hypothetical protein ACRRNA_17965 [Streptomyces sp. DW26H14]
MVSPCGGPAGRQVLDQDAQQPQRDAALPVRREGSARPVAGVLVDEVGLDRLGVFPEKV